MSRTVVGRAAWSPALAAARAAIRGDAARVLTEQITLARIPAPTGAEGARADYIAARLAEIGLADVHRDGVGNVLGTLPGAEPGAPVLVAAHLDSVLAPDPAAAPRREGEQRIFMPGITDNCRGLAAMLAIARALVAHGPRTRRPIRFVATVGEEGAGDLRGVRHYFASGEPGALAHAFVALDGAGTERIVHRAVAARRFRIEINGPGGHSWTDRGHPNPVLALCRTADLLARRAAEEPGCTLTLARIGGGHGINAIPNEAWLEVDCRAETAEPLERTEHALREIVARATAPEPGPPHCSTLEAYVTCIGRRPAGGTPVSAPLVQLALEATREIGRVPNLVGASTDASVPMSLGVPAICIGAGGEGGSVHTHQEWYADTDGARGLERALLVVAGAADAPAR